MTTRAEIAAIFEGIADIMQIRGDAPSKIRAYRWAARVLDTLQEDIHLLYEQNELTNVPGIGASIVEKIKELIDTGRCEYYEELKASIPAGVLDLMSISGVGPSTAAKLYHELNIDSLEALQQALNAQELRNLKGMGRKTEEKIKTGLEALLRYRQLKLMGYVLPPAQAVVSLLSSLEDVEAVSLAGDLRRRTETVRDAQIVAACSNTACHVAMKLRDTLAAMEWIEAVDDNWTDSGGSAKLTGDAELHVKLTEPGRFGAALLYFTGSESHIAELNNLAGQLGLTPLEAGTSLTGELENQKIRKPESQRSRSFGPVWTRGKSEEEIYAALGLPIIAPELREGSGEIPAALTGQLPQLVDVGDIRGDLHIHSTWSDGSDTIETMAEAARELGYKYIGVCDHSISSKIANGLSIERLLSQLDAAKEIKEKISGIEILMGSEVDILKDGSLDYPDEILGKLDIVVASVHSGFSMDETTMTERIISAIESKLIHIVGHPTGRLLARRDPYQVDIDAIIDAAAENNTAFEINAYPDRLDLKDTHVRRAKERGVMLVINTDAHTAADLGLLVYGIYTARRGWLEKRDVLNALPLAELVKWLRDR